MLIDKKYTYTIKLAVTLMVVLTQLSCKKYLDKKPSESLAVPSSLADLQAVLNASILTVESTGYSELLADNIYLSSSTWNNANESERKSYIWDKDAIPTYNLTWSPAYEGIYYANFVLDYLPAISIDPAEQTEYNKIKGAALFFRAFAFHQMAQLFCKPYQSSAAADPGIVLRLTSGVAAPSERATVQQTYDQIVKDLKAAAELMPPKDVVSMRPCKAAAYALLARVYLSMRDYTNARLSAANALSINNVLLDYNSLTGNALPGFANNPEIIFSALPYQPYDQLRSGAGMIDSNLYRSYSANDLRKLVFFQTNSSGTFWKGSYFPEEGVDKVCTGLNTDEMYLIMAECNARAGDKDGSMEELNKLLRKRWKTGTFTDLTATDATDALNQVLTERRKELVYRGLRWSDLRRFNLEGANITLSRVVNGNTYTLPPNDLRWVLLIPDLETSRSGIAQNPR
jgi:starch-binding outer membrane protein, SusD/RagB family